MLVVDTDAAARDALHDFLQAKRYDVVAAANASGLLETIRMRRPHVVLLDVSLVHDEAIIASISATAPVIVTMVEGDIEMARRAVQAGAFDLAAKPFDLRRVRQLIDAAVEHAPDLL